MLRAGASEIDITPEIGSLIPGQWLRRHAENVRDPLLVNALVLESGDTRLAMVSVDAISLKNTLVADARDLILNATGIPPENVFLAATHTHTGPPVMDGLGTEIDPKAVARLTNEIAAAVAEADRALEPASIATWHGVAPNLAFPRRYRMRDGSVVMHPPKGSPDIIGPEDEADPTIAGFHVHNSDGGCMATCVNFACHPIVVGGERSYSADYPGGVRRALKRMYGEDTVALYMNGPCGDIGPDKVEDVAAHRHGEEWLERIGTGIAGFAIGLASVAKATEDVELKAASTTVRLPTKTVPAELVREAEERLSEEDIAVPPQDQELIKLREYVLLHREHASEPGVDAEVAALAIGDLAMVSLPGEIFAEFGRQIRAQSPFEHTVVAELANGCHGYVPTPKAFPAGGYETWLARSSKLAPEAGELLVRAATSVLDEVQQP